MLWTHGEYSQESNGSMILTPNGDGYHQVQDACGAISNLMENNDDTIYIPWWSISQDIERGFVLKMQKFDLTWYAPFYQVSTTPEMLPTQKLRNITLGSDVSVAPSKRDVQPNGAANVRDGVAVAVSAVILGLGAMVL